MKLMDISEDKTKPWHIIAKREGEREREKKPILSGQIFRYKFFLVRTRSLLVCAKAAPSLSFSTLFVFEILFILFYVCRCGHFVCVCISGLHAFSALRAQKRYQIL